jgi:O-acetylserine/cysteine efflux transporter
MSGLRFAAVSLLLSPFILKHRPTGRWREMFWFAFTLGTLHFAFVFIGMHMGLSVATSVITTQMGVPFSCMLGTIFLKDKLGAWRSTGLVVAFIGLTMIAGAPDVTENITAFMLVLAGAFAWSVSNIIAKKLHDMPVMALVGWAALISFPQLLLLSAIMENNQLEILATAPLRPTLGIVYSVLFSTLVAYGLWYYLLSKHQVSQVVPFSLLIPFFGIGASMWLLGDGLTWQIVAGGALTMAGVGVIVIRKPKILEGGEPV